MSNVLHQSLALGSDGSMSSMPAPRSLNPNGFSGNDSESQLSLDDICEAADIDRMDKFEHFVSAANTFLNSTTSFVVYIIMILLSIVTIVWTVLDPSPSNVLFWIIEALVIFIMFAEMCVKLLAMGPKMYLRHLGNWADIIVLLLVLVSLGIYVHQVRVANTSSGVKDVGLVAYIFRNISQVLRVMVMVKNSTAVRHKDVDMLRIRLDEDDNERLTSNLSTTMEQL